MARMRTTEIQVYKDLGSETSIARNGFKQIGRSRLSFLNLDGSERCLYLSISRYVRNQIEISVRNASKLSIHRFFGLHLRFVLGSWNGPLTRGLNHPFKMRVASKSGSLLSHPCVPRGYHMNAPVA